MRRLATVLSVATLASCEVCGPPGEPLVDAVIVFEAPPPADRYLRIEMLNAQGEHLTTSSWLTPDEFATTDNNFRHSMGKCDQTLQQSGAFTMRAWLTLSRDAMVPDPLDPQGLTLFDVTCTHERGCIAASDSVRVTVREP